MSGEWYGPMGRASGLARFASPYRFIVRYACRKNMIQVHTREII
jgi:hypothetical protein